ncbi:MAG: NAD(P)/FAD-dependent oxidoreductase [Solirubrobacterales bacterium]
MLYDENTYVIIGNGAAGYYAADSIRKNDKNGKIHIISEESVLTYLRPQLSKFLGSEVDDSKFYVSQEQWYSDNNIQVTLSTKVKRINTENNLILLNDGGIIGYSKLILANGSHNFIPDLPGVQFDNVFSLRTISDAKKIKKQIVKGKKGIIVGGGVLGLEAAWSMKNAGMEVTVLENASRLLSRQVDEEGAEMFSQSIAKSGVNVITNANVVEIIGDKGVTGLKLKTGEILDADMVLFSVGIRPNTELALQCGIAVNKGVLVNDKMETSCKNIYACGDTAEFNGKVFGNWAAAMNMGKVAGANAAGVETLFKEFVPSLFFDSMNISLFSCGNYNENNHQLTKKHPEGSYMKLYFDGDIITGGFLIGDTKLAVQVLNAVKKGLNTAEVKEKFNI